MVETYKRKSKHMMTRPVVKAALLECLLLIKLSVNKSIKCQFLPEAVILHSDQGSQYTSLEY